MAELNVLAAMVTCLSSCFLKLDFYLKYSVVTAFCDTARIEKPINSDALV